MQYIRLTPSNLRFVLCGDVQGKVDEVTRRKGRMFVSRIMVLQTTEWECKDQNTTLGNRRTSRGTTDEVVMSSKRKSSKNRSLAGVRAAAHLAEKRQNVLGVNVYS